MLPNALHAPPGSPQTCTPLISRPSAPVLSSSSIDGREKEGRRRHSVSEDCVDVGLSRPLSIQALVQKRQREEAAAAAAQRKQQEGRRAALLLQEELDGLHAQLDRWHWLTLPYLNTAKCSPNYSSARLALLIQWLPCIP
jgi:ubiquitin